MLRPILYGILMWAICLYAFRRGGWAERLAAGGIIVATYATTLLLSPHATRFHHLEGPVAVVDALFFVLLLIIALRSDKFWPLWLAAMQGLTLLSHLSAYVPSIKPWVYYHAAVIWIYPMLIILAFAVHRHDRDRAEVKRRNR